MTTRSSLAIRLATHICIGGLVIFGVISSFIMFRTVQLRDRALHSALVAHADALQPLISSNETGAIELDFDDRIMSEYSDRYPGAFFRLETESGTVIKQSDFSRNIPRTATAPGSEWDAPVTGRIFRCLKRRILLSPDEEARSPERPAPVYLIVGIARDDIDREYANLSRYVIFGSGTGLFLLCLMSWVMVRRSLAPLSALKRELDGFSQSHLRPITIDAPDEIASVIAALNSLTAQLSDAFDRERAFTADAAHELRTPITELRTLAEVELRRAAGDPARMASFSAARAIALRMQDLVEKLLMLARADASMLPLEPAIVPVVELVREIIASLYPIMTERKLQTKLRMERDMNVTTDCALFRLVLENLIGNAAAHADEETVIEIEAERIERSFILRVRNRARDLKEGDIDRLFDRFRRLDSARKTGRSHHGLGLSLARSLASVLGGTIRAEMSGDAMVEFILTLPSDISIPSDAER